MGIKASFGGGIVAAVMAATALSSTVCADAQTTELKYDWGVCDTLAMYNVGPGITYSKLVYHDKPLIIWLVEVDLTNQYNSVEQAPSRMAVPDTKRWTVPTFQTELSKPGHNVCVAWNHDFFSYDDGIAIGLNIHNGQPNYTKFSRSTLAFDDKKHAEVFRAGINPYVVIGEEKAYIDFFNRAAVSYRGNCVLYNMFNASTLTEAGRYIALQPIDKWAVNRPEGTRCRVTAISDEPIQTSADTYVLYLRNEKLHALDNAAVGDIATVYQTFDAPLWGVIPENIMEGFHGYVSIVHDGVLHKGEYDDFENGSGYPNGRSYELSSRTMAGINKEGSRLYMAVNEAGSGKSEAINCIEMAAFLVEHGANDVVNFDSGGSAAISLDGEMLNYPMRGGSIRPVADAMLAVSTAPEDDVAASIGFTNRRRRMPMLGATPLGVMAYNMYGDIVSKDVTKDCSFECVPAELGYVDADGVLHASDNAVSGKIVATYNAAGKTLTAEMPVFLAQIDGVKPAKSAMLIDKYRRQILGLRGVCGGINIDVDPSAFEWTASPEGVVEIDDKGYVTGKANGTTTITGRYNGLEVNVEVTVEIPESDIDITRFDDGTVFGMKYASTLIKNFSAVTTDLPEGWDRGVSLTFDLKSNRNPLVTFNPGASIRLYSLPNSLTLTMNDRDNIVKEIKMDFVDAEGTRFNLTNAVVSGQQDFVFKFEESDGTEMLTPRYPLTFEKMYFTMVKKNVTGARLDLRSITANYPGMGAADDITTDARDGGAMVVRRQGDNIAIELEGANVGMSKVRVSTISGAIVLSADADFSSGTAGVYAPALAPGIYLVTVYSDALSRPLTAKLIVR